MRSSIASFMPSRGGGATLWLSMIAGTRVRTQPVDALLDDPVRLPHLLDSHEIAVVAVAVRPDRNVELHLVVDLVGLLAAQIPRDAGTAQHRTGKAERDRAFRRNDA